MEDIIENETEDDGFDFPEDYDVSDMLNEVDLDKELLVVTDRYLKPYYKINAQREKNDICIRIHSNRICMLSLAPSHAILQDGYEIEKISFKVTDKLDRATNKVSGKGKHGAQALQETSNICIITCTNGEIWLIKCCISGKLIQINEALIKDPQLIKQPPHLGGYLAIVLPSIKVYENMKNRLLTEDQYKIAIIQNNEEENNSKNNDALNTCKRVRESDASPDREEKILKL